jgi:hypothetical protein
MSYRLTAESGTIISECLMSYVNQDDYLQERIEGRKSKISTAESRRHLTMPTLSMTAETSLTTYTYETLTMTQTREYDAKTAKLRQTPVYGDMNTDGILTATGDGIIISGDDDLATCAGDGIIISQLPETAL